MKNQIKISSAKGFTLVELLVVIAIIGVMSGVIMVSIQSSITRSKRASALTSAASVLPELVTCQDDGGDIIKPNDPTQGGGTICNVTGHTAAWPNILKTGWTYVVANKILNANIGSMSFTLTNAADSTSPITCTFASNGCV